MSNTNLLKPCPFCGSPAELHETKHIPEGIDYTPRCTDTSCPGRCSKKYTSKEDAISKWNTRNYSFNAARRKKSKELGKDCYIIGCTSFASADILYARLCNYLFDAGIPCREFNSRLIIHIPSAGVAIRLMSIQSPHYADALVGFRGKIVSEVEVDKWLLSYEKSLKNI